MARKLLTKEEIAELEQKPQIAKVTRSTVTCTPEFKQMTEDFYLEK